MSLGLQLMQAVLEKLYTEQRTILSRLNYISGNLCCQNEQTDVILLNKRLTIRM